jgi:hypothetical protein
MSLRLSVFPSLGTTLLLASALAACGGGDDDDTSDGDDSAACEEATQQSDLAWIQENIFDRSCNISGSCHTGDAPDAQGLSLDADVAQENLVGVPAQGENAAGLNLVEPGNPDQSYIMVVLGEFGADDPRLSDQGLMPPNSAFDCRDEKRGAIGRWIESL